MTFSTWYLIQTKWSAEEIIANGWSIIFTTLDNIVGDYLLNREQPIWEKRFESRLNSITKEFGDILNGNTLDNIHKEYESTIGDKRTEYGNGINNASHPLGSSSTATGMSTNDVVSKDSRSMLSFIKSRYSMVTIEDFIFARFKDLFILLY